MSLTKVTIGPSILLSFTLPCNRFTVPYTCANSSRAQVCKYPFLRYSLLQAKNVTRGGSSDVLVRGFELVVEARDQARYDARGEPELEIYRYITINIKTKSLFWLI